MDHAGYRYSYIATFPIATWFELAISICKIKHMHGRLKPITSTEDSPDTSSPHASLHSIYLISDFEILMRFQRESMRFS